MMVVYTIVSNFDRHKAHSPWAQSIDLHRSFFPCYADWNLCWMVAVVTSPSYHSSDLKSSWELEIVGVCRMAWSMHLPRILSCLAYGRRQIPWAYSQRPDIVRLCWTKGHDSTTLARGSPEAASNPYCLPHSPYLTVAIVRDYGIVPVAKVQTSAVWHNATRSDFYRVWLLSWHRRSTGKLERHCKISALTERERGLDRRWSLKGSCVLSVLSTQ